MSTFTTYESIGQKEDVSDIITDITPFDTPFFSMMKSQKVHNRIYQYQSDSLRSPAANAQVVPPIQKTPTWQRRDITYAMAKFSHEDGAPSTSSD